MPYLMCDIIGIASGERKIPRHDMRLMRNCKCLTLWPQRHAEADDDDEDYEAMAASECKWMRDFESDKREDMPWIIGLWFWWLSENHSMHQPNVFQLQLYRLRTGIDKVWCTWGSTIEKMICGMRIGVGAPGMCMCNVRLNQGLKDVFMATCLTGAYAGVRTIHPWSDFTEAVGVGAV